MSKITIAQQAFNAVPEFEKIYRKFFEKYTIAGKSKSCTSNYLLQISKMVIYFKTSPLEVSIDQIEEYLFYLKDIVKTSKSSFSHFVYGLKSMYTMFNNEELLISLPIIPHDKKLPVVFSIEEIKILLHTPALLKHKVLFAVIYDGGLRISELVNIKISDVDFNRKTIHIREAKFKKDRYVPISDATIKGVKIYMDTSKPKVWLFNGRVRGEQISREGIRHVFKAALKKSKINKNACVHTLRHSYATHLIEMGLDIISVKNQLGHADISTTMMYLHIAQSNPSAGFSPLSVIYPLTK